MFIVMLTFIVIVCIHAWYMPMRIASLCYYSPTLLGFCGHHFKTMTITIIKARFLLDDVSIVVNSIILVIIVYDDC